SLSEANPSAWASWPVRSLRWISWQETIFSHPTPGANARDPALKRQDFHRRSVVVLSPRRIALMNWRLNRICGIPPRSARSGLHSDDLQLAKDNDHCQNGKNAKEPIQPLLGQLV